LSPPAAAVSSSTSSSVVCCTRCGQELSPRCLVQTCSVRRAGASDGRLVDKETMCKRCGSELTAKCILSQCCDSLSTYAYQG
jgi:hypothetical protein